MGYSTSLITLERIAPQFSVLLEKGSCIWEKPDGAGRSWASHWSYKLREGLYLAGLYPDQVPALAAVAHSVRIITQPTKVVAITLEVQGELPLAKAGPALAQARGSTEADNEQVRTLEDILELFTTRTSSGIYRVLRHNLSEFELATLSHTLSEQGWMLLKDRTGALTLAPDDPAVPVEAKVPAAV